MGRRIPVRVLSIMTIAAMLVSSIGWAEAPVVEAKSYKGTPLYEMLNDSKIDNFFSTDKDQEYVEGEALVKFKTGADLTQKQEAKVEAFDAGDSVIKSATIDEIYDFAPAEDGGYHEDDEAYLDHNNRFAVIKSASMSTDQLVEKLNASPYVEVAEPNYRIENDSVNDTYYSRQWALNGANGINVENQWNKGNTGKVTAEGSGENIVAIVDTGVDYTHEDLKDHMWVNRHQSALRGKYGFDFIDKDPDPMDENGHGTHCAGIVGAVADNAKGVSGVNQDVKIMALRILDEDGTSTASYELAAYNYINRAIDLGENVVAINNSWGGSSGSEIMQKLIDITGAKGAITVCAAGNESSNNDSEGVYPANIESGYKISVAATKADGTLADFSNYGTETVDLAAPGQQILSTVSYNSYVPSLYSGDKASKLTAYYNDGSEDFDDIIKSDSVTVSHSSEDFLDDASGSYNIMNNDDDGFGYLAIPYTVPEDFDENSTRKLAVSFDMKNNGDPGSSGFFDIPPLYTVADVSAETVEELNDETAIDIFNSRAESDTDAVDVIPFEENMDIWRGERLIVANNDEAKAGDTRYIVFTFLMLQSDEDYNIFIDNFGVSNFVDPSEFGKYEFYSGTSMAAPVVSGAVALLSAAEKNAGTYSPELVVSEITSSVDKSIPNETISGGNLDLDMIGKGFILKLGSAEVNTHDDTIRLTGANLNAADLKVEISRDGGKTYTDAEICKDSQGNPIAAGGYVEIKNNRWINNFVNIRVTGTKNGQTKVVKKNNVWLVNGKNQFERSTGNYGAYLFPATATDGKYLYAASSDEDSIAKLMVDEINTEEVIKEFKQSEIKSIFETYAESSDIEHYDFQFGDDIAYIDGKLYNIASFSAVDIADSDDFDDFWISKNDAVTSLDDDDDDEEDADHDQPGTPYSSEYKLLAINKDGSGYSVISNIPDSLKTVTNTTLAAYNGKLYIIGGYDYAADDYEGAISRDVYIYDPASAKWTVKTNALPSARADGKAFQVGNKLIYTLGAASSADSVKNKAPHNLIFDGKEWKESSADVSFVFDGEDMGYGSDRTVCYKGYPGAYKDGIVYIGMLAEDYGDTFYYDVNKDEYEDSGYSYRNRLVYEESDEGMLYVKPDAVYVVGNKAVAVCQDMEYEISTLDISGVNATVSLAKKVKGGKVTGLGSFYPGNRHQFTAKAGTGYYVKSFKVGSTAAKTNTVTKRIIGSEKATPVFARYRIRLNRTKTSVKAGKKYRIRARVTPTKAASQRGACVYKSSNRKYATVNSKGVVTTRAAGKGKTVTIKVYPKKDKKKVVKVKIAIK